MGCGAGVKARAKTLELQGKYAKAIVDDHKIIIVGSSTKRPLRRVEVKKYKDVLSPNAQKIDQCVQLVDGVRSEVFGGDCMYIPYKTKESIDTLNDLQSGLETHVLLYPGEGGPPERFVISTVAKKTKDWKYKVRYDDPDRTGTLTHSPQKAPRSPGASKERHEMQYRQWKHKQDQAATEAEQEWQELPCGVR